MFVYRSVPFLGGSGLQTRCWFQLQLFVYFDPRGMIWDDVPHVDLAAKSLKKILKYPENR